MDFLGGPEVTLPGLAPFATLGKGLCETGETGEKNQNSVFML